MAQSVVTDSANENMLGIAFTCTKFNYAASGDTVLVPVGCLSAAVMVVSGTAPTVTISAGSTTDTVTVTGGTTGSGAVLISRHGGNPASQR